jgi:hypothetical protein
MPFKTSTWPNLTGWAFCFLGFEEVFLLRVLRHTAVGRGGAAMKRLLVPLASREVLQPMHDA